jgi:GNAT superfamily N-acetyltransferase
MTPYEILITAQEQPSSELQKKMDHLLATQAELSLRKSTTFLELKIAGKTQGLAQVTLTLNYLLLDNIWVDESMQKQGYGIRLYQAVEDLARQQKCQKILLQTFDFLNTLSFWQRFGFQCVGEVPDCPEGYKLYYLVKNLS